MWSGSRGLSSAIFIVIDSVFRAASDRIAMKALLRQIANRPNKPDGQFRKCFLDKSGVEYGG
jgi:hypothetical protein